MFSHFISAAFFFTCSKMQVSITPEATLTIQWLIRRMRLCTLEQLFTILINNVKTSNQMKRSSQLKFHAEM